MALTREFRDTVQARATHDAEFRRGLLIEAVDCLLDGDVGTGKLMLRDYIKATLGFEKLGASIKKSPKSLMRMFSADGNPRLSNLLEVVVELQRVEGVRLVTTLKQKRRA